MTDRGEEKELHPQHKAQIAQDKADRSLAKVDKANRREMTALVVGLVIIWITTVILGAITIVSLQNELAKTQQLVGFVAQEQAPAAQRHSQQIIVDIEKCLAWVVAKDTFHGGTPPVKPPNCQA